MWKRIKMVIEIVKGLPIIIGVLISVAYVTLAERKIMAAVQRRKGPTKIGYIGLLQPLVDAAKLIIKEMIIPQQTKLTSIFIIAPMLSLTVHIIS